MAILDKMTKAEQKLVAGDWLTHLPDMGSWRIMMLARLVGPLLISIGLTPKKGFSKNYEVQYSIQNLSVMSDFLFLTLSYRPRYFFIEYNRMEI